MQNFTSDYKQYLSLEVIDFPKGEGGVSPTLYTSSDKRQGTEQVKYKKQEQMVLFFSFLRVLVHVMFLFKTKALQNVQNSKPQL